MASLRSNLKFKNSYFLSLAFEQAKVNLGCTGTNPSVGCIVEKNGSVISSGRTSLKGRPHAEYNALKKKINFKNSNIYITLEPCSHYGVTPPCTNKIIQKKIKNVFFSIFDEDKRSKKFSVKKLKKRNIRVKTGINRKYGLTFYKSYFSSKKKLLPYLDAKIAISKDYFTKNKKSKWITNEYSRKRSHLLRSKYDCILSTSKSINEDNSKLNCRIDGLENKSPSVVIIDRKLRLKRGIKIIKERGNRKIYLFTSVFNKAKENYFKKRGVRIIRLNKMKTQKDFIDILFKLNSFGYSRILLESGLNFMNFSLRSRIIQNLYIFKTNNNLYKNGINYSSPNLLKKIKLNKKIKVNLFGDSLYKINLK
tara:strand:+ start:2719 stop:3813 length:1095 start_codon:yes stop_codon:yes gene_type:complete